MTISLTTPPPDDILRIHSPLGRIEITGDGTAITSLTIEKAGMLPRDTEPERPTPLLVRAARQLSEYFAGARKQFDVPVKLVGSPFQQAVWAALSNLGWGEVTTYGTIGVVTGRHSAGRAVGRAIGANPIPLIVPCHRVLASGGKITGYSPGQGIPTKIWLLDHEGIIHATRDAHAA